MHFDITNYLIGCQSERYIIMETITTIMIKIKNYNNKNLGKLGKFWTKKDIQLSLCH